MKLYCYHTPSHDVFVDSWFLPTMRDTYEIVRVRDDRQYCPTARFREGGWRETQVNKVALWLQASSESDVFIGSDVDVQWFGKTEEVILQELGDRDFSVQSYHNGTICSGFFICRGNGNTRQMWSHILKDLESKRSEGEQDLLLKYLNAAHGLKWSELSERFWTPSAHYDTLTAIRLPHNIIMHHATYTVGIENKVLQLAHVKSLAGQLPSVRS